MPLTPGQEVALGIVTPALSDLAAGARLEAVLEGDPRSDAEVVARWDHLSPVVEAFYARMGVPRDVDALADTVGPPVADTEDETMNLPAVDTEDETVNLPAVDTEDETVMLPAVDVEDSAPPEPGTESAEEPISQQELFSDADKAEEPVGRVDSESHERLMDEGPGEGLHPAARLLYDDVLWLFNVNDGEGALISLERLLTIGQVDEEVAEFLELNGDKLFGLYEGYIGPFDKVPVRGDTTPEAMPAGYLSQGALQSVFELIDGTRSIADLIDASDQTPLETCASLEQLHRARLVQL
jgi:hypothetical protein